MTSCHGETNKSARKWLVYHGLLTQFINKDVHMLLHPFMLLLKEDVTQLVVVRRRHNVFTVKVNIPPLPVQKLLTTKMTRNCS